MKNATGNGISGTGSFAPKEYRWAVLLARRERQISVAMIQRSIGVGYTRASSIVDRMTTEGIVLSGTSNVRQVSPNIPPLCESEAFDLMHALNEAERARNSKNRPAGISDFELVERLRTLTYRNDQRAAAVDALRLVVDHMNKMTVRREVERIIGYW